VTAGQYTAFLNAVAGVDTHGLHNGQATGAQNLSTTEDGAYYLDGAAGYADLQAVTREADWKWAIPIKGNRLQ